jgi:hypothetical protein
MHGRFENEKQQHHHHHYYYYYYYYYYYHQYYYRYYYYYYYWFHGNLGPRASWLQNARAQESAGPLGPTGPHHHANLFHSRFFPSRLSRSSHLCFVRVRVARLGGRWRLGWLT